MDGSLYINTENAGNTAASGTLTVVLDPLLTYTNAFPTPLSFDGTTVVWNIESLPAGSDAYFYVEIVAPTFEQMGSTLSTTCQTITFDDMGNEVSNLASSSSGIVNCSFDPNDKTGFPSGTTDQHYIHNGTDLEYLVRFQNTGNYQAFNIRIDDQLDSDLDFSTFQLVGSSHACVPLTDMQTGLVQFFFDNINLPDSTSNEVGSHGWLRYRISPQDNLAEMTTIDNTAYIYFDFNPAVITNTYSYTVSDLLFGVDENESILLNVFPNPANDQLTVNLKENTGQVFVRILDLNGREVRNFGSFYSKTFQLNVADLANGLYTFQISGNEKMPAANIKISVLR
jgi:uncharacterized repeat protein (TIGR01451 family)